MHGYLSALMQTEASSTRLEHVSEGLGDGHRVEGVVASFLTSGAGGSVVQYTGQRSKGEATSPL